MPRTMLSSTRLNSTKGTVSLSTRYLIHLASSILETDRLTLFSRAPQVGVQFVQVGNDPEAGEFLDQLDRDLVRHMGENARVGPIRWLVLCSSLTSSFVQ